MMVLEGCMASAVHMQTTGGNTPGSKSIHRDLADQLFRLAPLVQLQAVGSAGSTRYSAIDFMLKQRRI
jgi:hypothetical protein